MSHPLDGVWLKIVRAEQHLDSVASEILRHKEKCRLVGKKNIETDGVEFFADFPDPPSMLSLMIGDCLYNLRCDLDYLVWQLVESNPPNRGSARNQFPICESAERFRQQLQRGRLSGVPPTAQTIIERAQPYHGVNNLHFSRLLGLNYLANIDKHRTLVLMHALRTWPSKHRIRKLSGREQSGGKDLPKIL
jgi:hypothetical protein